MIGRKCAQCARDIAHHLLCPHCRELNSPAAPDDPFAMLGLAATFDVDQDVLEARFLELSRELHPDFFQDRPELRARSVFLAAALNEAFDTLKDPFRRAEHLLKRAGGKSSSEDKRLPPGFLVEMMELREASDAAGDAGHGEVLRDLDLRRASAVLELSRWFRSLGEGADRAAVLAQIRQDLNVVNYLNSLRRDLLGTR
ncbi:MAG: hypothetical protein U1E76_12700 [Planctomycetota bacterium]